MRKIKISAAVYDAIASHGRFGEMEDDVLRRVFNLAPANQPMKVGRTGRGNKRYATKRMHAAVEDEHLVVAFEDGERFMERLPHDRTDKAKIRAVRESAVRFALENGASDPGQTNHVRKALTEAGYHLTR